MGKTKRIGLWLRDAAVALILFAFVAGFFSIPLWWAYATVQSCGWMGLFVQCRIEARP